MKIVITGSIAYDYIMSFPGRFRDHILPDKLDSLALSFLVESMTKQRGGVEKIFLVHELQKVFYDHAKKRKVSQRTLDQMFQYPRGRGADHGCIRHEPGHDDHIHVRFKCPPGDGKCSGADR